MTGTSLPIWNDSSRTTDDRVEALVAAMTLVEKTAQLYGIWVGASETGSAVSPFQHDDEDVVDFDAIVEHGLGQLTRPFGSAPIDAAVGVLSLARTQQKIVGSSRFGIPAIAHEECLAGFTAWGATAYPIPLAWAATFEPTLVQELAARIGRSMRSVGIHQGLAPVLDVVRDHRWGRVEETMGEDPYLVGTIATAYVRGLQSSGIIATLKHFVGYSGSRAGRNFAPVSMGERERRDVLLVPFEMAVRDGGVGSVMHAYTDTDGIPSAADERMLTGLLRDSWGFEGTVVADYGGIGFLRSQHGVTESDTGAAVMALTAGVDVELPTVEVYGQVLVDAVAAGLIDEVLVDRSLRRVLRQKIELGLLDPQWSAIPAGREQVDGNIDDIKGTVDLDLAEDRDLARLVAERSIVLLTNDGSLPIAAGLESSPRRIAVIGPAGDDPAVLLGAYAFPNHVLDHHPGVESLISIPTVVEAIRAEYDGADVEFVAGVTVTGGDPSQIEAATHAARRADLVIVVVGDKAGLFGRGTSGEGSDSADLNLPGLQMELLEAILDCGVPVIACVVSGRPYFLAGVPERAIAVVQAFLPGEEGASAIAGVISGRVSPAGRLPVSIPSHPSTQPATYLAPALARQNRLSSIDPTARFPFGHGLSYSEFDWSDLRTSASRTSTDGQVRLSLTVQNRSERRGVEVVQLYLHDPVASVVRPVVRLIGYSAVELEAHETVQLSFEVAADLTAFTGQDGHLIVEPGRIELRLGRSSEDNWESAVVELDGPSREPGHARALTAPATIIRSSTTKGTSNDGS